MKKSSLTTKLIAVLTLLTVIAYFGFQTWRYFTSPENTETVYTYRAERTLALNGYVVRDEEAIDCSDPLVELTHAEGERVAKGKRVATVYQSAAALEAEREVASLRAQLEQLRYAQTAAHDAESALRLDGELEEGVIALRAALAEKNYAAVDGAAASLEATVLRREYAYRGNAGLSERIETLEAQIAAAHTTNDGARAVLAPFAGTYSAVADGYESVLTPAALREMTPAAFAQVQPAPTTSTVGKLIRGSKWYYAAVVAETDAAPLKTGQELEIVLGGASAPLSVTVDRIGRAEDGQCLLVLSSSQQLSAVSMLRAQSAELILESHIGLRVPKNALRVDEKGLGVYCRIGRQAWFKPVKLLYQGEDYCLVSPGEIEALRDSDYIFYTLRDGDEVIVSAEGLYNGKVLEQA